MPACGIKLRFGALDGIFRRLDLFRARGQATNRQIGCGLIDRGLSHFHLGGRIVKLCLRHHPAFRQVLRTQKRSLGIVCLCLCCPDGRIQNCHFIWALANLQIRQLRAGLRQRRVGLRNGDLCVRVLRLCYRLARFDAITTPDGNGLNLRHFQRCKLHEFTLNITNGKRLRTTCGEEIRSKRNHTENAHANTSPFLAASFAARIAMRFWRAIAATAAASSAPIVDQPMRRFTASRPMRK